MEDCGVLTVASCQIPTQAALSLLLFSRTEGKNKMKNLVGQDKDSEIVHQLLSQAKQI